jgi:hypothetical protein
VIEGDSDGPGKRSVPGVVEREVRKRRWIVDAEIERSGTGDGRAKENAVNGPFLGCDRDAKKPKSLRSASRPISSILLLKPELRDSIELMHCFCARGMRSRESYNDRSETFVASTWESHLHASCICTPFKNPSSQFHRD